MTVPFSVYRRGSFEFVILQYLANVAFYFLFIAHVDSLEKFRKVLFVMVLSSLTFSLAGLVKGEFCDGRYFTGSSMFDPNDTAFMEVSFLCFGLCVLLGSYRTRQSARVRERACLRGSRAVYGIAGWRSWPRLDHPFVPAPSNSRSAESSQGHARQ